MSIRQILTPAEISEFEETGEISDQMFDRLYEHYVHEMPYGTAKARDGDPYQWIGDRLAEDLSG